MTILVLADVRGTGVLDLFGHPFVRHSLLAGTAIAAACGLVGYFVVLRAQVFGVDALSHVALTGALAALAFGIDVRVGLFAATLAVAFVIGLLGERGAADDVVIGTVFTWVLGLGVLFLSIFTTDRSAGNGAAGVNVLFGSMFGLSAGQALVAALVGVAICAAAVVLARPLVFSSFDAAVAQARGVRVGALGIALLLLVGLSTAEGTQAVGALLVLGLVAAPAGAAVRLTDRPFAAFWLSGAIAVASMWSGIVWSYLAADVPPSFAVMAVATSFYAVAYQLSRWRRPWERRTAS